MRTRIKTGVMVVLFALLIGGLFGGQTGLFAKDKEKKPDPFAKVNKQKVETAITKGLEFLLGEVKKRQPLKLGGIQSTIAPDLNADELVLLTLIKGGADTKSEDFNWLLKTVLDKKLAWTYQASLRAMILEELDGQKYQAEIAECGQFLIDNQCKNGQWSYGKPVEALKAKITPPSSKDSGGNTKSVRKITLQIRNKGKGQEGVGDNSNTQYACLGLRACMQASVVIPTEVFNLAMQFIEKHQKKDGSWGYDSMHGQSDPGYGSMTVGMLGSIAICKFYLTGGKLPDRDPAVLKGVQWLSDNFTVTTNPKYSEPQMATTLLYYYLYAMERVGAFLETEEFVDKEWYPAGAELLLKEQQADGCWKRTPEDTCFAILFLRRATKPLRMTITGEKEK